MEENEEKDDLLLDIEELRYKHILLRNLQKKAIISIEELEADNLKLNFDNIQLRETIKTLTESNAKSNMLMINAIKNNNDMKDDYRNRIQALERQLEGK
jgi:hypothetical protein